MRRHTYQPSEPRMLGAANAAAARGLQVTIFRYARTEIERLRPRLDQRVLLRVVGERATHRGPASNTYRR